MAFHGLLVSSGFSSPVIRKKVADTAKEYGYTKAHIVTTARPEKEKAPWTKVTKQQLEEMGMSVSFVDFDVGESIDGDTNLIYVCGGNTFHLLYSVQRAKISIKKQIENMCNRNGLYIGSSAGAVIAGPSIESAGEVHPDKNNDNISDLRGFNFIQQHIIPHYIKALESEVEKFRKKYALKHNEILRLQDGEGWYINKSRQGRTEKIKE